MKTSIIAFAFVLVGGIAAVHAAPPISRPDVNAVTESVACKWVNGVRKCDVRRYRRAKNNNDDAPYGSYPNNGRSEDYPVGSTNWWRAMDRECRGGFVCR